MKVITLTATCVVLFATTANGYTFIQQSIEFNKKQKSIECLTKAVYHEARGESTKGQIAVAYSVINRKEDKRFPDSTCDVVFQPDQYSYIDQTKFDTASKEWESSKQVAEQVYYKLVSDPTKGAKWYYNPKKAKPFWRKYAEGNIIQIGNHKFIENVRNK